MATALRVLRTAGGLRGCRTRKMGCCESTLLTPEEFLDEFEFTPSPLSEDTSAAEIEPAELIAKLEAEKAAAVEAEDFDKAKSLKAEIDAAKAEIDVGKDVTAVFTGAKLGITVDDEPGRPCVIISVQVRKKPGFAQGFLFTHLRPHHPLKSLTRAGGRRDRWRQGAVHHQCRERRPAGRASHG